MKGLTKSGGHSDVQRAGMEDLQAISTVLGDEKSYILGERPSDVDCTLFGFMCLILQDDSSLGGDHQASSKSATSVYKVVFNNICPITRYESMDKLRFPHKIIPPFMKCPMEWT